MCFLWKQTAPMQKQTFLARRRPAWKKFEQLLHRRRHSAKEAREFSRLLRELSNDLVLIRSRDWGQGLAAYLNDLVARGHNQFYQQPPAGGRAWWQFLTSGFPRLFRAHFGYFAVAAALFFVPLAVTWTVVQCDPVVALRILPAEALEEFDTMYRSPAEEDASADDTEEAVSDRDFNQQRTAMAGFYIQHNVGIALQCFARGLLLGAGTIYTLLYNGLMIGAVAGYVLSLGHTERFLSFVVSHGSFELTAIAVAGAAGLMLGDALVHPGQRSRIEALRMRGLEAVQLAGGAAAMLVLAALIEAFWSPAPFPAVIKYAVGASLWLVVWAYLWGAGRTP